MKRLTLIAVAAVFLAALFVPSRSEAVPAFARQTGMACNTCHFQHFPILNQFGRTFKANGFTMVGGQSLIEGDMLSLPSVLNASVVTKVRYQKTNGDDDDSGTNKGELQFPDEAALFFGGRVGEHIGFILEAQMADNNHPMFASFKIPVGFDLGHHVHAEVVPFTTDAFGPQFSFEVLNTGAIRNLRPIEHRSDISAVQYVGLQNEAQGIGFVAYHDTGYVNYTLWQPEVGSSDAQFLHYGRIVGTHQVAGWDLAGGVQLWAGESVSGASKTRHTADGWAVDFQAQGMVQAYPVGFYASYANADKSESTTTTNLFNTGTNDDKSAWSVFAEVGVLPGRATLSAGYRDGDTGDATNSDDNAITLAGLYQLTQNFQLQVDHTWRTGDFYDLPANNENADGDQLTTVMFFAAF